MRFRGVFFFEGGGRESVLFSVYLFVVDNEINSAYSRDFVSRTIFTLNGHGGALLLIYARKYIYIYFFSNAGPTKDFGFRSKRGKWDASKEFSRVTASPTVECVL